LPLLSLHFEKRDSSEKRISFLKYSLEREFASIGRGMGIYHHVLCLRRNQGAYLEAVEVECPANSVPDVVRQTGICHCFENTERVISTSVLGGLHHEYALQRTAA
jgi:hypothetical protein